MECDWPGDEPGALLRPGLRGSGGQAAVGLAIGRARRERLGLPGGPSAAGAGPEMHVFWLFFLYFWCFFAMISSIFSWFFYVFS